MPEPVSLSAVFSAIVSYVKTLLPSILKFLGILWVGEKLALITSGGNRQGVAIDTSAIIGVFLQIFPMFMTIYLFKVLIDMMKSFMTEITRTASEKPLGVM